jgi:hypothetical protein
MACWMTTNCSLGSFNSLTNMVKISIKTQMSRTVAVLTHKHWPFQVWFARYDYHSGKPCRYHWMDVFCYDVTLAMNLYYRRLTFISCGDMLWSVYKHSRSTDSGCHCLILDANKRHTAATSWSWRREMPQAHRNRSRKFTASGNTWSSQCWSSHTLRKERKTCYYSQRGLPNRLICYGK